MWYIVCQLIVLLDTLMFILLCNTFFVETLVSLSSSTYISHESDHQVTISVTSSTTSSTNFVIELHANSITASGINFLQ